MLSLRPKLANNFVEISAMGESKNKLKLTLLLKDKIQVCFMKMWNLGRTPYNFVVCYDFQSKIEYWKEVRYRKRAALMWIVLKTSTDEYLTWLS